MEAARSVESSVFRGGGAVARELAREARAAAASAQQESVSQVGDAAVDSAFGNFEAFVAAKLRTLDREI